MAARREQFINDASTTLNEALDNSETVITVTDGSVFPADGDFRVIVEDEVMLCTSRATNDLTVVRGVDDTTAVTHATSLAIKAVHTARNIIEHINDAAGVGTQAQGGGEHRNPFRLLNASNTTLTSSDFTWINQGTSSVANDPWGGMTATVTETTGDWKLLHKAAPTAPYILRANVMFGPGATFSASGSLMGIGWKESDSTKFVIGALETGDLLNFWRFTSPSVFSAAAATNVPIEFEWDELWLELEDDNTDLKYRVSMDGITYFEVGVDLRTTFMASAGPDRICWALNPRGAASKLMHLRTWIEQ